MKKGALTEIEKAAIRALFDEGKDSKEIKSVLDRSPNSRVVDSYVETLGEVDKTEDLRNDQLEAWKDVISESVSRLVKDGVTQENAQGLVREAMNKVDLDSEPSVDSLVSFAIGGNKNPNLHLNQIKRWGRSSIVSGTEASSKSADQNKQVTNQFSRKEKGAVFQPNPNKR